MTNSTETAAHPETKPSLRTGLLAGGNRLLARLRPAGFGVRALTAAILTATTLASVPAGAATHQRKPKPIVEIVAAGKVVHAGAPASGAVVYLENPTTMSIKSYLTDANGEFHFNNIAPQTDYEVWAEQNGEQSKHKFISQFSNHTRFNFTLKLQAAGKKKLLGIF